jgi:hypothetical protein
MRTTWVRLAILVAALAAGSTTIACKAREYSCTLDGECNAANGGAGRCVATHCAFFDPNCPGSELRWDESAGDDADECVPMTLAPDAGPSVDAAPVDAAPVDATPDEDATP